MGLKKLFSKAQETVDNLQRKTDEMQEKINNFSQNVGKDYADNTIQEEKALNTGFVCPVCGSEQSFGKKKTAHGELCSDCIQTLNEMDISHREAKKYTKEQIFAICNKNLTAIQRAEFFKVDNCPLALEADENCYYAGSACGGKIKTVTTGYSGGSKGYSVRLTKGLSYRTGNSSGKAVREQVLETSIPGTFVITGNRFALLTTQYGFEIPAGKVGNIEMRPDGVTLYAGKTAHIVITDDVKRIATVIRILIAATLEYEKQNENSSKEEKKPQRRKKKTEEPVFSVADEIRKFKQLADEGIITAEEFEKKKQELLNL